MEKSGRIRFDGSFFDKAGPLSSWNQKPATQAAVMEIPALVNRSRN
jgi:hypothetical protein